MMNPNEARRHKLGFDYFAKGFSPSQLADTYYRLTAESRQEQLLMECASFSEIDEEYNPEDQNADREQTETLIMESIRVKAFSRTAQTMAALARALNKQMADKQLSVGEAVIGRPKKSGLFATVTVQFPVSDGQTISIIFHSPDNNKMQITAQDEILAFRWLLNKRDITVAVSPEGEADVSLEEVGKRVAMLVERNAKAFASKQKDILEQKQAFEDLKTKVQAEQETNQTFVNNLTEAENSVEILDRQIASSKDQLAKVQDYNAGLQSQLDSLIAANAANAGKPQGEGEKTPEQIQTEQDAAEFETKKAAFASELTGRGLTAKGEAFQLESNGKTLFANMAKESGYQIGVRYYADSVTDKPEEKVFTSATIVGLDKQSANALAWIDKKLAAIKDDEAQRKAIAERETQQQAEEARIIEERRLVDLGTTAVPGVRLADAKEAGTTYEMFQKGEVTQAQWDAYMESLYSSNKATRPTAATTDEPAAVTILNDILAGSYSTSQEISDKLDEVAAALEAAGLMDQYDAKLNQAADYLTEALKREAA